MTPIVESIEVARRPEAVFAYVTDPSHLPEWQESVVRVRGEGGSPPAAGKPIVITRRVGRREMSMTAELAELSAPRRWVVHGLDGPIRGDVEGTIEPLGDGERSRVRLALDLKGYGIGKVLLPLVVRRQARAEMPKNLQNLKHQLEAS